MKRRKIPLTISVIILGLFGLGYFLVHDTHFAVLEPAGPVAAQEKSILLFALALSAVIVVPVFTLLAVFAWKYRESNTKARYTPEWSSNSKLEILWWGIPIFLILILSSVTYVSSHQLDPYKKLASNQKPIEVQVIALQWKWLFLYPEYDIATVNQLPVAMNRPIHFTLAADAPMNGFWIPKLGTQVYAMTGMSSQLNLMADKTGDFTGYTSNINGTGYADMKFRVHATDGAAFTKWINQTKQSPQKLDSAEYEKLAAVGISSEKSYRLTDKNLYENVVNKYMKMSGDDNASMHGTHMMEEM